MYGKFKAVIAFARSSMVSSDLYVKSDRRASSARKLTRKTGSTVLLMSPLEPRLLCCPQLRDIRLQLSQNMATERK